MKLTAPLATASFLILLVAAAAAFPDYQDEQVILCEVDDDCMGENTVCQDEVCACTWGFTMVTGDCYLDETFDGNLFRRKRTPGSKVEKLEKKLIKAQVKEAKKHGAVVVPVAHVPVAHIPVAHVPIAHVPVAHVPVVHVSRHRRTPGTVSKLERKIVKAQAKRVAKKEAKKVLTSRHRRDSHQKKIEKLERKLVKEQIKQSKKDAKKGRIGYVPVAAAPHYVAYHPQPVHHAKSKPKGFWARTKSALG